MKRFLYILFLAGSAFAQTITYQPSTENFPNPERGFYKHTETHSSAYAPLNVSTLNTYRPQGITLLIRVFYLEQFIAAPISATYLSNMQADFNKVRGAKLKCIVRFAYSDDEVAGLNNATKAVILSHIQQLSTVLFENRDVIASFQAGFIGTWGEWYNTDYFGTSGLTVQNYADRKDVMEALLLHFPSNRQIQVRTPKIKKKMYGLDPLNATEAYTLTSRGRTAHHNDCFLASSSDYGTYENIAVDYPYLEQETRYLVMGGETCNDQSTFISCQNALDKLNLFSWDYLNADYNEGVLQSWTDNGCMSDIARRLGYRFSLVNSSYTDSQITLTISNTGFGHVYNVRSAYLVYRNVETGIEYTSEVDTDVRLWLKGTPIVVSELVPAMPAGSYKVFLSLPDPLLPTVPEYAIRMANLNVWENAKGLNDLHMTINVSGLHLGEYLQSDLNAYIGDGNLNISADFKKFKLYNIIGQLVMTGSEIRTDISALPSGIYMLKVDGYNAIKITKQ